MRQNGMVLVDEHGMEVNVGHVTKSSKGVAVRVKGGRPPHKPSSTGWVYCEDVEGHSYEWFPSVIGARWEPEEGRS